MVKCRYAKVMVLLRILILFIGAHTYIFLSGFVYHYLEQPAKAHNADAVERIVEQHFMDPNGPKKSKQEVVKLLKVAFAEDQRNHIRGEFSSLWKCYLFSLTSITTVGNSGLYLQASGSRLFFIFTTLIGLLLYLYLLLNIVVGLLTVYKSCIDYLIMKQLQKESTVRYKQFTDLAVVGLSYLTTFLFLIITAMAAILSGHGYLFGLFAVFDSVLTVGNLHVLAFVYPWNEIGFVISINLILLMGLSFFYTTCYVTFHFVSGNDFNELVQYWWGHSHDNGYEVVGQDEAGPFQAFMDKSMDKSANGGMKNGHGKEDDGKNPFLDDEDEAEPSGTNNFYSLTPDFLQHENEVSHDQAGTVGVTQENTSE